MNLRFGISRPTPRRTAIAPVAMTLPPASSRLGDLAASFRTQQWSNEAAPQLSAALHRLSELGEEVNMGNKKKAANKMQDMKGRAKQKIGTAIGDSDMTNDGLSDQRSSALSSAKESLHDASDSIMHSAKSNK